jgi:hypothetical protein
MATVLQLAGMLPRDPEFRQWVGQYTMPPSEVTADEAAEFIRVACKVESRRELATDREAEQRFHNIIRKPFLLWKERQAEYAE